MNSLSELDSRITSCMQVDRFRLRRQLRTLRDSQRKKKTIDQSLTRLVADVERSEKLRAERAGNVPKIEFPEELPIAARKQEIIDTIAANQVVIICGETGSGKSTQLPKMCLEMGRGVDGMIGHTQPRRIAARTVAARVAEELKRPLGKDVGFKIRFTDSTGPETFVKLMTDGMLLAETSRDRFLDAYDTIIIDEAHERSLNIDFLMGYIKRLLPKRRDLKLIITSATIDAERFAAHFGSDEQPAPVIEVSGRTYPVDIIYRPPEDDDAPGGPSNDPDWMRGVLDAVEELSQLGPGDILVFMPTERDIFETAKSLRGRQLGRHGMPTEILPLYARLSTKEQNRVFQPRSGMRRVVIATNVAESSLTVPGIHYVVDTGTARISRYSARSKMQRLPIEAVSQASADQRAGRCGRIGPGVCMRLYSQQDYNTRDRYTAPEIQRTNLASVILQTIALKLGDIERFPFLDPPRPTTIKDGYKTLHELGAIDEEQQITRLGRQLSDLPVDPRIGRIILAGHEEGCLHELLIIASALEIRDARERPIEKQQAADEAHKQFADGESDFLSYLKLWDFYHQLREKVSRSQLRKACRQNFLSYNRMREWSDVHRQLLELVERTGAKTGKRGGRQSRQKPGQPARRISKSAAQKSQRSLNPTNPAKALDASSGEEATEYDSAAIHRALLAGLLVNVAYREKDIPKHQAANKAKAGKPAKSSNEYTVANGGKAFIWPGSGTSAKKPKWIVAAEQIETTRRFLRTVGRIDPEWIEPLAEHLVTRTYSEPTWNGKQGSAMAFERVSLFGLPVVPRRGVRFGKIDPAKSRELMIQHGLVEGDIELKAEFLDYNRLIEEEVESLQAKLRRHDLVLGDEVRFDFYDQRIPADVADVVSLKQWLKQIASEQPQLLFMTREDLMAEASESVDTTAFPDSVSVNNVKIPLEYNLKPGSENDGITLTVPQNALNQLDSQRLGWLVPGLIEEKIVALIKSLPKSTRRALVPAPDTARDVMTRLKFGAGDFLKTVSEELSRIAGERIPTKAFDETALPSHLQMKVNVVDSTGKSVANGRNLPALRKQVGQAAAVSFQQLDQGEWARDNITEWGDMELPEMVRLAQDGASYQAFPCLLDRGTSVSMRLVHTASRAAQHTKGGVLRLFVTEKYRKLKTQVDNLPGLNRVLINAMTLPDSKNFKQQLVDLTAARALADVKVEPRKPAAFKQLADIGANRINIAIQDVAGLIPGMFEGYQQAKVMLENSVATQSKYALDDMNAQMRALVTPGFLTRYDWGWLLQYPRYFQAMRFRLKQLAVASKRDEKATRQIYEHSRRYVDRYKQHSDRNIHDANLIYYRWMIEELRVSLFAPQLRTAIQVSDEKLNAQWAKVKS